MEREEGVEYGSKSLYECKVSALSPINSADPSSAEKSVHVAMGTAAAAADYESITFLTVHPFDVFHLAKKIECAAKEWKCRSSSQSGSPNDLLDEHCQAVIKQINAGDNSAAFPHLLNVFALMILSTKRNTPVKPLVTQMETGFVYNPQLVWNKLWEDKEDK